MSEADLFNLSDLAEHGKIGKERSKFFGEHFNLRWNPFPDVGVPNAAVTAMAPIRERELRKIAEFVRKAFEPPYKRQVLVIRGTYGSGKSFILRGIAEAVNSSQTGKAEEAVMAVYVSRPSFEAHALNKAILQSIGLDNIRKMIWGVIRKELAHDLKFEAPVLKTLWGQLINPTRKSISTSQMNLFNSENLPPSLKSTFDPNRFDDYRDFLAEFDKQGWSRATLQAYFSELLSRGLRSQSPASVPEAYIKLLLASDERATWDALLELDLKRKGDKTDFVLRFLHDLLSLLKAAGYIYLLVVIDEFEQATMKQLLTQRQQADYAYTIMEIITNIDVGLGIIFGITNEGYEALSKVVPLADRLGSTMIDLSPLRHDELRKLAEYYLALGRPEKKRSKRGQAEQLYPFSDELLQKIVNGLQPLGLGLTPRNALQFLHFLLEYHFENNMAKLTDASVSSALASFRQLKSVELRTNRSR